MVASRASSLLTRFGDLLGLSTFAIAWPLLDLLSRHAEFLTVHGVGWADTGILVSILVLAPPLVLLGIETLLGSVVGALRIHRGMVAGLVALGLLVPLVRAFAGPWPLLLAALGGALAWVGQRALLMRTLVNWTPVAVPLFVILFFTRPSVAPALTPAVATLPPPATGMSPTPVVVLILDALPLASLLDDDEAIDAAWFPRFAALAEDSIWLRNHTTVADETTEAVPAILTGREPRPDATPQLADHPTNLFTLLRKTHRIHASEVVTRLCPPEYLAGSPARGTRLARTLRDLTVVGAHLVVPRPWSEGLPRIDQGWADFGALFGGREQLGLQPRRMAERLRGFAADIEAAKTPGLHVIHVLLPHDPFVFFPDGTRYTDTGREPSGQDNYTAVRNQDEWAAVHSLQRHLHQLGYLDRLLGDLVERLRALGLYDSSLMVITADHGVSFRPGKPGRRPDPVAPGDIALVPLFLKLPGQAQGGTIDLRPATTLDILPTVMDVLGATEDFGFDGVSLLARGFPHRATKSIRSRDETRTFPADRLHTLPVDPVRERARHPSPYQSWIGRPLADFPVTEAWPGLFRVEDSRQATVDLGSGLVPAEVVGSLRDAGGEPWIAVAVNGRIAAITRPYRRPKDRDAADWSALPPLDFWRDGANEVAAFRIEDAAGIFRLRPEGSWRPSFVGRALGREAVVGVPEAGFWAPRVRGDERFRWTNGAATLRIPLHGARPGFVRVLLLATTRPSTRIELRANGNVLAAEDIGPDRWELRVPLRLGAEVEELRLELISDTQPRDGREFGVPVGGIWLE